MQMTAEHPNHARASANRQRVVWQGWRIDLPIRWNPVKLEGTFEEGYALFADLHRARLGIRWSRNRRVGKDPASWIKRTMRDEVGQLAADEAQPYTKADAAFVDSLLYLEPEPPGRDVWIAYSRCSDRLIQVIHHARRRERILPDQLLPTLVDESDQPLRRWSVLDLSCQVPADLALEKPLLFAGDLGLRFKGRRGELTVRQIAPATLALKRMPLENWLRKQQRDVKKHYRPSKSHEAVTLQTPDGRELKGVEAPLPRRRRFFWKFSLQPMLRTIAVHDPTRDRVVIVQGAGQGLDLYRVIESVGWAGTRESGS